MIPLIQKEIDSFVLLWNSHRIRKQSDTVLPDGIPNHIYNFPENYDLRECGMYANNSILASSTCSCICLTINKFQSLFAKAIHVFEEELFVYVYC
jgi:hypothetical protein